MALGASLQLFKHLFVKEVRIVNDIVAHDRSRSADHQNIIGGIVSAVFNFCIGNVVGSEASSRQCVYGLINIQEIYIIGRSAQNPSAVGIEGTAVRIVDKYLGSVKREKRLKAAIYAL